MRQVVTTSRFHLIEDGERGAGGVEYDLPGVPADGEAEEAARRRAIRDVVAGLAHNLNNIMAISLGTAEQIADDMPPDHPLHTSARMNMTAAHRAAHLTRRLMMYAGLSVVGCDSVDVDAEIRELVGCGEGSRRDPIRMKLDSRSAVVAMDRDAFFETIDVVLDNAFAAIVGVENGTIWVRTSVEAETGPDAKALVVVEIADNGVGMSPDTLRRAKEPFFTTREVGGGVGLGLSFADGFARMSGGSLALESRFGWGTRVRLTLPAASLGRGMEG